MRVEKVYMTPFVSRGVYGSEIDVSDFVQIDGLSKIKRSIDSTNYSIGVYRFNDLNLKCVNAKGTFNENDSRSIFPITRDKAKVRVEVLEIDASVFPPTTTATIQFEGLINDEATRQDITNDTINLTALSKDSVFRTIRVPAGIVTVGTSAQTALFSILNQPRITALLTVDIANINPVYDYPIDKPEELDNLEVREALDLLVRAANSVLLIKSDTVYIQARENSSPGAPLELFGRGAIKNNCNIISITEYNSGKHRQFNSIRLNDGLVVLEDTDSIAEYGLKKIEFDFPMLEDVGVLTQVGETIASEFKIPKIELKVKVPTIMAQGYDLLDLVSLDAPFLTKPKSGDFLPVFGVAVFGALETPFPQTFGSVQIDPAWKFKIIEIEDDPKIFQTILKLRQSGNNFGDGVF